MLATSVSNQSCYQFGLLSHFSTQTQWLRTTISHPFASELLSPLTAHFNHKDIELQALSQALILTRRFSAISSVIIHQIVQVGATLHIMYMGGRSSTDLGPYFPYNHAPQGATAMSKSGRGTTAHFCPAFSSLMATFWIPCRGSSFTWVHFIFI